LLLAATSCSVATCSRAACSSIRWVHQAGCGPERGPGALTPPMSIAARTSPRSRRKGTRLGASHLRQERSLVVSGEGVPLRAAVFDLVGAMCRPCAPLGWSDRGRGRERDRGEALSLCGVEVPTLLGRIVAETKRWGTGDCVGDAAAPAPAGPGRSERRSRRRRRWVATRRTSWTCHTPSGQRRCLGRTALAGFSAFGRR
jgi:hypothetical protein